MQLGSLVFLACISAIQILETSSSPVVCGGQGWMGKVTCDGCQCCPDGCLCPNGVNCHITCPKTPAQCKSINSTPNPTTVPQTTQNVETTAKTTWRSTHVNTVPGGSTQKYTAKTTPGPNPGTYGTTTAAPGSLILDEEFDTLNFRLWKHELTMGGGGNWEFELYHNNRSTSYVRDGILYIQPGFISDFFGINGVAQMESMAELDMWGASPADQCTGNAFYGCKRSAGAGGNYLNPITSARLRTAEYFSFKYGTVEVRAKMPKGDWLWPAIWLLPRDNEYGNWPASGEIDLVESRGNPNYPAQYGGGPETFGSTLHFGPAYDMDPFEKAHATYTLPSGTFNDDFHTFGLRWTPERIMTYVDSVDNVVLDLPITQDFWTLGQFPKTYKNPWRNAHKNAPFDKEYYIILNVAVAPCTYIAIEEGGAMLEGGYARKITVRAIRSSGGTSGYFPDGVGGKPWTNHDAHAVNNFWNSKSQWYGTWDDNNGSPGEGSAMQVDSVKVWAM